jgi:predicted alpha/beta superfamily hydrolase
MKTILLLFCASVFSSLIYSQRIDSVKIYSEILNKERKVLVYTPPEYYYKPDSKFEVIYVFDAQAREYFDLVHSTLSFLNNSQYPMIVVGIVSEERNKDFLPVNEYPETFKDYNGNLGNADKFLNFISHELIPYIDQHYRTLPKKISLGHSNGATFITYCLLKNPGMFDTYIALSPNYAYDKEQLVKMIEKFDPGMISQKKFIYMCNSDEGGDWISARKKALSLLQSKLFKDKIIVVNQDFSATFNHITVYPIGVYYGLKNFLDYQYFTATNLIAYYSGLYDKKIIDLNSEKLKQLSNSFLQKGKAADATEILIWASKLFPDDLSLYNNIGELYQKQNKKPEAVKYYKLYKEKLEQSKELFTDGQYEDLKKIIDTRLKSLENNE